MTRRAVFAIPGDLATPTGGYAYARCLLSTARAVGLALEPLRLPGDYPFPAPRSLAETRDLLSQVPADLPLLVDGLAFGAMPAGLLDAVKAPLAVLLHHPLGLETGLDPARAAALIQSERAALTRARAIIVPSAATRRDVVETLGADERLITVAPPGLDPVEAAPSPQTPPLILSVGSLTPRKGHDVMIEALARLTAMDWTACIAGPDDRDAVWAARLRALVAARGLGDRVALPGAVDEPTRDGLLRRASIFCLPSRHEGYGMVYAEAMARGLPVVAGDIAASRALVPAEAGLLVPTDNADAFAEALGALLADPARRAAMGAAARAHAATLPDWPSTTRIIANVLERLSP